MSRFVFWETSPEMLTAAALLYADLAAAQMQLALVKLARKYRADQPRVPAGNSNGGQWMDAGGGDWARGKWQKAERSCDGYGQFSFER
jgi:hypothetical protein